MDELNPIELNPTAYDCNMITGISDNDEGNIATISIVNPFSNSLKLVNKTALKNATITLSGISGNKIDTWYYPELVAGKSTEIDLPSSLNDGIYILSIQDNNSMSTYKLLHRNN